MKYIAPEIRSFSKDDIRNNVVASATCTSAVCPAGQTFTCGVGSNYVHSVHDEII